ncbi:MAG: hypothetical protein HQM09_17785 [Candidatus Riflebacteria bacterium]|nr:hypothetical protein [Candidatus Riflebacteria bacterium]
MNTAVFRWGSLLLLFLLLTHGSPIFRGHAPGSFLIPESWPSHDDVALVNYASYFSGRMFLEGFPTWKFEEFFGNNFFLNVLAKPFDPQNIVGALLVDSLRWNLFEIFGWLRFLMLFASVIGVFLFMQYSHGWSERRAFLGSLIFLLFPSSFFYANFQNYWNIIACVPYCLMSIDFYIAKPTRLRALLVALVVAFPLLCGLINIYVNYVLIACAYMLFRIFERIDPKLRWEMVRKGVLIIFLALGLNAVGWVPTAIEMASNLGQSYNVDSHPVLNPIEFPFQILERLFPGRLTQTLDKLVATSFPPPSYEPWQELRGLGLIILLLGSWRQFIGRRKHFEIWWILGLLGIGIGEFIAEKLHISVVMSITSILKITLYQECLGFIFFATLMVEGLIGMLAISQELSQGRRILFAAGLAVLALWQIRFGVASDVLRIPAASDVIALAGHVSEQGLWALLPDNRWNLMVQHPFYSLALLLSFFSTVLFGWILLFPLTCDIRRLAAIGCFVFSMPFTATGYTGGLLPIPVRNEVYSSDFFRVQENERIVRSLLEQEGFAYRAMYFDCVETLRKRFPDRRWIDPAEALPGPKIFRYWYSSDKASFRSMFTGISEPDGGFLLFPSRRKKDFFVNNPDLFRPVGLASTHFDAIDPFDERVATGMNVKYILSPYEFPGLRLIHQNTTESWKYLYEIASPTPIYSIHMENSLSDKGVIKRCNLGEKTIEMDVSSQASTTVHLNIALDNYWKATVSGVGVRVEPCGSIGVDIHIPPGESRILLIHDYWPLLWSGFITLATWLLFGCITISSSGHENDLLELPGRG